MADKYDIDMWENVLNDPPESYKKWFKEEKKYLNKNIKKNASVLEVGCGNGRLLEFLRKKKGKLIGVDHNKKAVEKANEKLLNTPGSEIILSEAKNLHLKSGQIDFIICMGNTFGNFGPEKTEILAEMKRVLKDNGEIIISVFSENAFEERMKLYKKVGFPMKKIIGTSVHYESACDVGVSEQFSEEQLRSIFKKAKLEVINLKKLDISYIIKLKKAKND